tara:strand:+ start:125 stop:319 length:195 start_codon:yes stop_codon:yes gene_type:complete
MKLIKLTPENSKFYVDSTIVFKTRGRKCFCIIQRVSESGKTIYIDHPDLQNSLQIVSRCVYVII